MDISNLPSLSHVLHKTLLKAYVLFSSVEESYIGLNFLFEGGSELFVLNVGDEINIFDFLPLSYSQEDIIRYQEL